MSKLKTLSDAAKATIDEVIMQAKEISDAAVLEKEQVELALAEAAPICKGCGESLPSKASLDALQRLTGQEVGSLGERLHWSIGVCNEACATKHNDLLTAQKKLIRGEFRLEVVRGH